MSSSAQKRINGCGNTGQILTLYHIGIDGKAQAVAHGFKHLACGYYPETLEARTYGVLLCMHCAGSLGFSLLPGAEPASC